MAEQDRSATRRRLALIGAVVVFLLFVGALIGKPYLDERMSRQPPSDDPRTLQIETPSLPVPPPPLSRADIIALSSRAASAFATNAAPPKQNIDLVGRNFVVKIPFGCHGPQARGDAISGAYWERDDARGTITLRAYPRIWTGVEWVGELAAPAELDAVEGFWAPRPWILSEDCPKALPPPPAEAEGEEGEEGAEGEPKPKPSAVQQTLGLAMFFGPNSSRVQQRGARPYEYVGNAPADGAAIAPKGFKLVLGGRLAAFESGEPVRCHDNAGGRPTCLVAVDFDLVAFEDAASGKTLAEWRSH